MGSGSLIHTVQTWVAYVMLTVDGVCCTSELSGSIDTPIWAICEMGRLLPKTLFIIVDWPAISSSFLSCDILKIADGFVLEM